MGGATCAWLTIGTASYASAADQSVEVPFHFCLGWKCLIDVLMHCRIDPK